MMWEKQCMKCCLHEVTFTCPASICTLNHTEPCMECGELRTGH